MLHVLGLEEWRLGQVLLRKDIGGMIGFTGVMTKLKWLVDFPR